ncbi:MAG: TonB-dependent receptor [Gemmatimonadota bacterium]
MDGARAGGAGRSLLLILNAVVSRSTAAGASLLLLFLLLLSPLPPPVMGQVRPIELEGFVVTGTPVPRTTSAVTSHVTVLDGEELRRRGVTRVADALSGVPGLVVVQSGSYGSVTSTFLRGAEGDHVKILVDGVEMNQAGGGFDLAGLVLSDVERIEVVRGPASAFYGSDAMAGVIHIITRRGGGPRKASVFGRGGSYGSMNWGADVHGGTGTSGYSLSLSRATSDGILAFNNDFRNTVVSGKAFAHPSEKTRLELSGRYSDRIYHFPTDGSGNVVDQNALTFGEEWTLSAVASRAVSDRVELLATLRTYRWDGGSDDRLDGPGDTLGYYGYTSEDSFRRTSGELQGSLVPWAGSVMSVGVELEEEAQHSVSESFSQFGPSQGDSEYERWNRGYYAQMVSEASGWAGNLGIRLDENEQYGEYFTYQAGISYSTPASGTRLFGSVGRGMKEPAFLETSSTGFTVGNPDLEPERSFVWEVGLQQPLGKGGIATSLTWFRQSLRDLIQYTFTSPEAGGPNFFNVAKARTQGIEATLAAPLGALSMSGAFTYLDSKVLDAGFDEGEGAVFVEGSSLVRRPRHQGSLSAGYLFARGVLNGDVRWTGSRSDRDFSAWPASPVDLPSYTLLNLGVEVNVLSAKGGRPGINLQVRGENLLDEEYQEVFGFDAPGRAFMVGFQMTFGEAGS